MENRHSDGHPHRLTWDYDRAELIADRDTECMHDPVGDQLGAIVVPGQAVILALRAAERAVLFAVLIYAVSLLAALALSAAYNMWPISPLKWWLRRFDHAAIYLLIGGTYTPFLALSDGGVTAAVLLALIWFTVTIGVVLKLVLPGRFDRLAIALY